MMIMLPSASEAARSTSCQRQRAASSGEWLAEHTAASAKQNQSHNPTCHTHHTVSSCDYMGSLNCSIQLVAAQQSITHLMHIANCSTSCVKPCRQLCVHHGQVLRAGSLQRPDISISRLMIATAIGITPYTISCTIYPMDCTGLYTTYSRLDTDCSSILNFRTRIALIA